MKITGKVLKEYLEKCANYFTIENDEITVEPEYVIPYAEHFNYDMIDGCEYTIQVSKPRGSRITSLTFKGKPVHEEDEFTLAINNYLAGCGGNFHMFKDCEEILSIQDDMVERLSMYMKAHPVIEVDHHDNITVIK